MHQLGGVQKYPFGFEEHHLHHERKDTELEKSPEWNNSVVNLKLVIASLLEINGIT